MQKLKLSPKLFLKIRLKIRLKLSPKLFIKIRLKIRLRLKRDLRVEGGVP